MCGASDEQKQTFQEQSLFYKQLRQQYKVVFGESQDILNKLTASFQPILDKGINQQGFSPEELTALNTQAVEGTAQNYRKAAAALGNVQAAEGGGTAYIPSGAKLQQQQELLSSAAGNESALKTAITENNYDIGRQNYLAAAGGLGGVAGQLNPEGFAGVTNQAGGNTAQTANEITQANNSWMNLVGAALGAAGTAAGGLCWIAAAVFDGWEDPRTYRVRSYLLGDFRQSWYGRLLVNLYLKYGERISRNKLAVYLLTPVFHFINYVAS